MANMILEQILMKLSKAMFEKFEYKLSSEAYDLAGSHAGGSLRAGQQAN